VRAESESNSSLRDGSAATCSRRHYKEAMLATDLRHEVPVDRF